ncbi:hypothetical protein [Nocardia mangyaensis]|uniref:hypothetical protein n=1 Tax=Nocardia mangyaensis TaxID=2213200 RepID=UPI0012EC0736|nr:hypothetical protein [Nocardia mangyaensis]
MWISRVLVDLFRKRVAPPVARLEEAGRASGEAMHGVAGELRRSKQQLQEDDLEGRRPILGAGADGGDTQHRRPEDTDPGLPSSSTGSDSVTRIRLDLSTPDYTAKLAEAPIYRKKGMVRAHAAREDEHVETILADGTRETTNRAREGQIIITNPGGEQYIYKAAEPDIAAARAHFDQRHEATTEPGVYRPNGKIRAIPNDTGHPIEIMAPWGEPMNTGVDGKIAVPVDPQNPDEISMDRYLIGGQEFTDTYVLDT